MGDVVRCELWVRLWGLSFPSVRLLTESWWRNLGQHFSILSTLWWPIFNNETKLKFHFFPNQSTGDGRRHHCSVLRLMILSDWAKKSQVSLTSTKIATSADMFPLRVTSKNTHHCEARFASSSNNLDLVQTFSTSTQKYTANHEILCCIPSYCICCCFLPSHQDQWILYRE